MILCNKTFSQQLLKHSSRILKFRESNLIRCIHHLKKEEQSEVEKVTLQGVFLNGALSLSKASVGYVANSPALISDAAHSFSDISTDLVTLYSYKKAREPADWDHPFGHGKFETVGATAVGGVLVATGAGVAFHSVSSFLETFSYAASQALPVEFSQTYPYIAMGMALASVVLKEGMYRITLKVGQKSNSKVVIANAHHHRSDAYSSLIALVGIGGGIFMDLPWLDPLAGLMVAGMVVKTGADVTKDSMKDLLDTNASAEFIAEVAHVCSSVPGVELNSRTKSLRARQMGPDILVDVSITVDGDLSASSAHQLGEHVRMKIMTRFPSVSDVRIHFDPCTRQEFHRIANPDILPTPDIFEEKIRAVIRRCCPEILGATKIFIVYNREGTITSKLDILLQPELTIREANVIAAKIRKILIEEIEELATVDVDLELSELEESEKEIIVVPESERDARDAT